ncbi:MAG: hypothetical protein R6V59_03650 [Dehalococcoidia bacterium]
MKNSKRPILLIIVFSTIAIVSIIVIVGGFLSCLPEEESEDLEKQIQSVVAGFDFNNPRSFHSVAEIADLGEDTIPIVKEMANSDSLFDRWAAIIALSTLLRKNQNLREEILPVFEKVLEDENENLRLVAGAELVSLGDKEGIPTLISLLESERITSFGNPEPLGYRSNICLKHYTGQNFSTKNGWQGWWDSNKDSLFWNSQTEMFEVRTQ